MPIGFGFGIPAQRVAASAGGGYDYASLFTGGYTGFVYDGLQSAIKQSSGGSEATVDGDPVGYIEDISGTGNHAVQSTGAAKPEFYTDANGIRSWRYGTISTLRFMTFTNTTQTSAAQSTVAVFVHRSHSPGGNGAYLISNYYSGVWSGGYYMAGSSYPDTNDLWYMANSSVTISSLACQIDDDPLTPAIATYIKEGTGSNQFKMTAWNIADGTQNATMTATQAGSGGASIQIGVSGALSTDPIEACFLMHINRALTAQERDDIVADLAARFGGWAP